MTYTDSPVRVMHLGHHVGREILVEGQWLRIARCNGVGRHPMVNVWVDYRPEPLELRHDFTVPVRDPDPQPFTVIGTVHEWHSSHAYRPVAAFTGMPVVLLAEETSVSPHVTVCPAPTADRAFGVLIASGAVPPPCATGEGEPGMWTVVGEVDSNSAFGNLHLIAAIQGATSEVLGVYDSMLGYRFTTEVVADSGAEALSLASTEWHDSQEWD